MELKAGYKQTEVGVIPKDWDCRTIGELNPFVTSGSRGWADYYAEYGDLFVRITNMQRESIYLDLSESKFVSVPELSAEGKRTSLMNGDVIVSITADIGISGYIDDSIPKPAYINQHIALIRFPDSQVDSKFISYFLASERVQKLFKGRSDQGAKAGMNLQSVRDIRIAVPPKAEQESIAKALSDMDSLIQSLEQQIIKKQQIKQGAMQILLNPYDKQNILKPDWEQKSFDKVFSIGHGRDQKGIISTGGCFPILATSGEIGRTNHYLYDKPSVLIGRKGTIDEPQYMDTPFWTIDTLFYTEVFKPNNAKFLFYLFCLIDWYSYNEASGVPSLSAKTILNIEAAMPPADEQNRIADILTEMDNEIAELEAKLTKHKQLKQGMMQNLLTGTVRLV